MASRADALGHRERNRTDVLLSKTALQNALARSITAFDFNRVSRRLLWRDRVAVLLYHDPKPETLDVYPTRLNTLCDFVPLSHAASRGDGRPRAAITLDDGAVGNADLFPLLSTMFAAGVGSYLKRQTQCDASDITTLTNRQR